MTTQDLILLSLLLQTDELPGAMALVDTMIRETEESCAQ